MRSTLRKQEHQKALSTPAMRIVRRMLAGSKTVSFAMSTNALWCLTDLQEKRDHSRGRHEAARTAEERIMELFAHARQRARRRGDRDVDALRGQGERARLPKRGEKPKLFRGDVFGLTAVSEIPCRILERSRHPGDTP